MQLSIQWLSSNKNLWSVKLYECMNIFTKLLRNKHEKHSNAKKKFSFEIAHEKCCIKIWIKSNTFLLYFVWQNILNTFQLFAKEISSLSMFFCFYEFCTNKKTVFRDPRDKIKQQKDSRVYLNNRERRKV